ncbi:MAG: TetR/AcrR family transcriptional regulator [Pseudomonadota bacterium]
MGRPKAFDRKEAVRTAMNEIWLNGYEASSVKALSETLGITRSSFYNSFGSRENLFREVLQTYSEQSPDRALGKIGKGNEVLRAVCQVFKTVCEVRAGDPDHRGCLAVNSLTELVGKDEGLSCVLTEAVRASLDRFERLLLLAEENGELIIENRQATALALQNLLFGINVTSKVVHDSESLWQSVKLSLKGLGIYKLSFDL